MTYQLVYAIAGGAGAALLVANGMALTFAYIVQSARDVVLHRRREQWKKEILQAWKR